MIASRTNPERSEATRRALLDAACLLFAAHGYADTSTLQVCVAAGVTRGALYHHFADKRALLHALVARESEVVVAAIEAAAPQDAEPVEALLRGADAYLEAMAAPGRTQLLLIEGPAALGREAVAAVDAAHGEAALRGGLEAAGARGVDLDALAALLSAAFDRAALDVQNGHDQQAVSATMRWLLCRTLRI